MDENKKEATLLEIANAKFEELCKKDEEEKKAKQLEEENTRKKLAREILKQGIEKNISWLDISGHAMGGELNFKIPKVDKYGTYIFASLKDVLEVAREEGIDVINFENLKDIKEIKKAEFSFLYGSGEMRIISCSRH